ncbi:hypothetical protein GCM10023339_40020 [Alloalcanivorax gelatiniphagus]
MGPRRVESALCPAISIVAPAVRITGLVTAGAVSIDVTRTSATHLRSAHAGSEHGYSMTDSAATAAETRQETT